jgi:hypothetical protein
MPSFVNTFDVVAAQLGDDSGVLGAAAWVQHVVLDKHVEAHAASQPAAATDAT